MMKPITSAMAAALALWAGSVPAHAKAERPAPAPRLESHIVQTPAGFAICTCGSSCSATADKRPEPIRIGANVRLDSALMERAARAREEIRHAR